MFSPVEKGAEKMSIQRGKEPFCFAIIYVRLTLLCYIFWQDGGS